MRGLADKGFLRQVNKDKPFRYRVVRSFEDVSGRLLGDLLGACSAARVLNSSSGS